MPRRSAIQRAEARAKAAAARPRLTSTAEEAAESASGGPAPQSGGPAPGAMPASGGPASSGPHAGHYFLPPGSTVVEFTPAGPTPPSSGNFPLTDAEKTDIRCTFGAASYNGVLDRIKSARGGEYPLDWDRQVMQGEVFMPPRRA